MDPLAAALLAALIFPVALSMVRDRIGSGRDRLAAVLTTAVLLGGAVAALGATALTLPGTARIWDVGTLIGFQAQAVAFGFALDRVGLVMAALIGVVGAATTAFAGRYLLGDPQRATFLRWFAVTVAAAQVLVLSANLAQLAVAWLLVSVGLHRLLLHHGQRPRAVLAARSKFMISRIGDFALLGAIATLLPAAKTLDLAALAGLAGTPQLASAGPIAAVCLVVAAMCKSAQFPVHVWLPETLEAPTPVSALMHAGIINAGGFLLVRTAGLLSAVPAVLDALLVIGLVTAAIGVLAMWAQTDVKKSLAWSTVGQMGFMFLQCGLGAFAAALVHLVGHAGYKAHAFLRSGSIAGAVAAPPTAEGPLAAAVLRYVAASAAAVALILVLQRDGQVHAGGMLLVLAIGLALGQVWTSGVGSLLGRTVMVVILAVVAVPGLTAVHTWFGLPVAPEPFTRGPAGIILGGVVGLGLVALAVLSVALPWVAGRLLALRIHARQGWYIGIYAERLVRRCWPHTT